MVKGGMLAEADFMGILYDFMGSDFILWDSWDFICVILWDLMKQLSWIKLVYFHAYFTVEFMDISNHSGKG